MGHSLFKAQFVFRHPIMPIFICLGFVWFFFLSVCFVVWALPINQMCKQAFSCGLFQSLSKWGKKVNTRIKQQISLLLLQVGMLRSNYSRNQTKFLQYSIRSIEDQLVCFWKMEAECNYQVVKTKENGQHGNAHGLWIRREDGFKQMTMDSRGRRNACIDNKFDQLYQKFD